MKKLFSMLLVLAIAASSMALTSCGEKKTNSSEDESKVVSEGTSVDASGDASVDASKDDVLASKLEDTVTYKTLTGLDLTNGVSMKMSLDMGAMAMDITLYYKDTSACSETKVTTTEGTMTEKEITKDGKVYTLNDTEKVYTVADADPEEDKVEGFVQYFLSDIVYKTTATEEIDGVTYIVDTFDFIDGEGQAKFYSQDGVIKKVDMGLGQAMDLSFDLSVPDGVFDVPADYTQVSEQ